MLEGNIKIRADLFRLHDFQQGIRDFFRVTVEKSNPIEVVDGDQFPQQMWEIVFHPGVSPIKSGVLGYEIDLTDAFGYKAGDFPNNRGYRAGLIRAFDERDCTESTVMGAAFRYFNISPARRRG